MLSPKNLVRIILNTILGLILILVWVKFVNINQVLETLKTANFSIALFFFVFFIISLALRTLRLKILLSVYKIPFRNLFFLTFAGQFLSFMIPIRAGELARGIYLSTRYSLPIGKTMTWIFIDRFLDFWAVLLVMAILISPQQTSLPKETYFIALISLFGFSLGAVLAVKFSNLAKKLVSLVSLLIFIKKVRLGFSNFSATIIEGFEVLNRRPRSLFIFGFISLLATISDAALWYIAFISLGQYLPPLKIWLGSAMTGLTYLIPAAPGYIGSAEASGLAVFGLILGIDHNLASAATVLNHILTVIIILALGIIGLLNLDFNLNSLFNKILRKES